MKGVQGNQAAQVRMFAHDAIPVALGAINPDNGITLESGGYNYSVGDEITLNTVSGSDAAKIKVLSIGKQDIINVQAKSGEQFYLNGQKLGSNKLVLIKGKSYTFYQKASSNTGHGINFATNSSNPSGNIYSDGVSFQGSTPGTDRVVTWTVASDAPSTLYYYCVVHGYSMGGEIEIKESGDDFFDTYPNNNAIKSFEVVRQSGAKPFGKAYTLNFRLQGGTETASVHSKAFIGKVASIDLANTSDRGACIYIGEKMASITAKMESGLEATFKNIAKGSFMPILVKQITTATPDGGSAGVISDNDIIALY